MPLAAVVVGRASKGLGRLNRILSIFGKRGIGDQHSDGPGIRLRVGFYTFDAAFWRYVGRGARNPIVVTDDSGKFGYLLLLDYQNPHYNRLHFPDPSNFQS